MRRLLATVVACSLVISSMPALAETTSSTTADALVLTPQVVPVDGLSGFWLPVDQMQRVLLRLEAAKEMEKVIAAQDKLINVQENQIESLNLAVSTVKTLALSEHVRGEEFRTLATKQADTIESLNAWYNSPLFWTGIGAGGALILGLLSGIRDTSSSTINVAR